MRDFQLVRYCGDENTAVGLFHLWVLGWLSLFQGLIRICSAGTLDTDLKLWFVLRQDLKKKRYASIHHKDMSVL